MESTQDDIKSSKELKDFYEHEQQQHAEIMQHQQLLQQQQQQQQHHTHLRHLQQQVQRFHTEPLKEESSFSRKRKLYAIEEHVEQESALFAAKAELAAPDAAYDADVDDDVVPNVGMATELPLAKIQKLQSEREHIYELFQPWALKTYGDQAKTKTITLRKKGRILKALEGKEHSRPDSSKFRFWVKTKAFTTKRPEGFEEAPGSQRRFQPLPPNAVLSDSPSEVDLFVGSTNKDFGKRTYRKVAVVEEFFDIIYNVHMELGGRSGMHAGQKRTYRIITETYAFLPREAVTRFLSTCPECKKNLRPTSPATSSHNDEPTQNESSSELEVLNYSSHTESSLEAGPTTKSSTKPTTSVAMSKKRRNSFTDSSLKATSSTQSFEMVPKRRDSSPTQTQAVASATPISTQQQKLLHNQPLTQPTQLTLQQPLQQHLQQHLQQQSQPQLPASLPKIRINPQLQRPITPPLSAALIHDREPPPPPATAYAYHPLCFDMNALKSLNAGGSVSNDSLLRYYEFMRRFYVGGVGPAAAGFLPTSQPPPLLAPPFYGSDLMQSLRFPTSNLSTMPKALATPNPTPHTAAVVDKAPSSIVDISDDNDDDDMDETEVEDSKKFKSFAESSSRSFKAHSLATANIDRHDEITPSQTSAINLSKQFSNFRSNGNTPPPSAPPPKLEPTTPISPPTAATSTPSRTTFAALRIPQLRPPAQSNPALPPLDLERLKPITSTYLQLTRSMGLSDEDALRFDNLVSKDFKYSL